MSNDQPSSDRRIIVGTSVVDSLLISGDNNKLEINKNTYISVNEIKTHGFIEVSPYKGLKKFELKDADHFFGRDQFLGEFVSELEQTNLVLLLGASGSGKSSVVRAGLLPYLSETWGNHADSLTFTPDFDPFESLYSALVSLGYSQSEAKLARTGTGETLSQVVDTLKSPEQYWLIFIDQFEELFTVSEAAKRNCFISGLVELSKARIHDPSLKIVATMRADFLDQLDAFPANQLAGLTQKHRPLITQMQADQLRLAIEQPAAHHGVVFETGLVEEIIKDVQGRAGYLPLLQYTLDQLWETAKANELQQERTLRIATYRQLGGVRGALQQRVDQIYQGFSPDEQLVAQRIFLKLVQIGSDEAIGTDWKPFRRRTDIAEFTSEPEIKILRTLIDAHLLVSSGWDPTPENKNDAAGTQRSTVEIAHEVLLTSWSQLNDWIKQNRETITLRNRLNDDVRQWKITQSDDELWGGLKLETVIKLRNDSDFNELLGGFHPDANEFIDASVQLSDRKLLEQTQQALKVRMSAGDKRRADLLELLEACTVKFMIPGSHKANTGFFVAPGKILTSATSITKVENPSIDVFWSGQKKAIKASVDQCISSSDLAILKLHSEVEHPCVYLDTTFSMDDPFCTYGHLTQFNQGAYVTGKCRKRVRQDRQDIKFGLAPDSLELGSSPLLNWRTLKVCGIVQSTHAEKAASSLDPRDDVVVGTATSAATILSTVDGLKKEQQTFHRKNQRWRKLLPARCKPRTALLTGLGITILLILVQGFKGFQPFEFAFYDFLIRSRLNPPQPSDRFLIVNSTFSDVEAQQDRGEIVHESFSNETLAQLLSKIDTLNPLAVGLDVYREQPLEAETALRELFQRPNFFALCKAPTEEDPGNPPPPGVDPEQIGFSDFIDDRDRILRRYLLALRSEDSNEETRCVSTKSFGLVLAERYLERTKEIQTDVDFSNGCQVRFSNGVVIENVAHNTGGYQEHSDEDQRNFRGCQTLLEFRDNQGNQTYPTIDLETFLETSFTAEDFSERIILIGVDRIDAAGDNWRTPYDQRQDDRTLGVMIHAQMIDQIIDIASGESGSIWALPRSVDMLLLLLAAMVGGGLGWWVRSPQKLGLIILFVGGSTVIFSFTIFQADGWIPLMPHFIALSAASSYVCWCNQRLNSKQLAESVKLF